MIVDQPHGGGGRSFSALLRLLELAAAAAVFCLMIVTALDVAGRYLLAAPLPGATELTEILLGVAVFGSLPMVTGNGRHITVDTMEQLLSKRAASIVRWFSALISGVALLGLAWVVFELALKLQDSHLRTELLRIPLSPFAYFASAMCAFSGGWLLMYGIGLAKPSKAEHDE
jgi:TRAP-type transport system small permease protein